MKPDDYLDRDARRPMDWQDKVVTYGAAVAILFLLGMLAWGPQ